MPKESKGVRMSDDKEEKKDDLSNAKTYAWLNRKDRSAEDREREKREKETEFKKTIEESTRKVENLGLEKWEEFNTEYIIPIQETLQYCEQRLSDLTLKQKALKEYTYEESYHRRLVNVIKAELHKEFDAKLEALEKEKSSLLDLLYQLENTFESLTKLVARKLGKKLEE